MPSPPLFTSPQTTITYKPDTSQDTTIPTSGTGHANRPNITLPLFPITATYHLVHQPIPHDTTTYQEKDIAPGVLDPSRHHLPRPVPIPPGRK